MEEPQLMSGEEEWVSRRQTKQGEYMLKHVSMYMTEGS